MCESVYLDYHYYYFILFYRNGISLGEAFDNVRVGPGYAYFPAVSLSFAEQVQANFGSLPLRYPFYFFILSYHFQRLGV